MNCLIFCGHSADTRELNDSLYLISNKYVSCFAGEVRGKEPVKPPPVKPKGNADNNSDNEPNEPNNGDTCSVDGDPTDSLREAIEKIDTRTASQESSTGGRGHLAQFDLEPPTQPSALKDGILLKTWAICIKNWKAASDDEKKHGFVLWFVDMLWSGERAKYPLAVISKILDYLEDDILITYNIGCTTETTVRHSVLGEKFAKQNAMFCVPAFYAYTHNHVCQMLYHPNNIEGMGIKDVESLDNGTKTSSSTPGFPSLKNYTQALDIVVQEAVVSESLWLQNITEADLAQWEQEEATFFANVEEEPQRDLHVIAYIEALQKLWSLEARQRDFLKALLGRDPEAPNLENYQQQ
ncbi:hypothetical protein PsYK624_172520 [Phanerochaete sordida]|uniref:Uncharacterized protein n=1 Tax=Phanerochaete sordida TaxID=48140 RepID=A0A9P3LPY3_9APHY|nr:hypothetical protein PsYK624_172520 [Phanerochaete sordida]